MPGASIGALGVEGELYFDRLSLEGWAGIAGLNYVDPALLDKTGAFAIGDLAHYPGKLNLILQGFSEAAMAAHAIHPIVHPDQALHFEYSTTKGVPGG